MKTVLVTGGQGFIGSYLCMDLLNHGYRVISLDNYSKYGPVVRPQDSHPNCKIIKADVIDIRDISELRDIELDCIVAGAAMIGGIQYFHEFAYDLLATNERIMVATFDYAIEAHKKRNLNKILVLSSSMVFENTDEYPTKEDAIKRCPPPSSTYGFQKLATEYFCKGAWEQYGLPYTIVRPFNCIGIGEDKAIAKTVISQGNVKMQMSHVVPDLIYKAFQVGADGKLPILGDGEQVRHYTYGGDIARGIRMAMEHYKAFNEDFNISSPESLSVTQLAEKIWSRMYPGKPLVFENCPPMHYDVRMRSPDITKATKVLGFSSEKNVDDVIDEVIEWVRNYYGFSKYQESVC